MPKHYVLTAETGSCHVTGADARLRRQPSFEAAAGRYGLVGGWVGAAALIRLRVAWESTGNVLCLDQAVSLCGLGPQPPWLRQGLLQRSQRPGGVRVVAPDRGSARLRQAPELECAR